MVIAAPESLMPDTTPLKVSSPVPAAPVSLTVKESVPDTYCIVSVSNRICVPYICTPFVAVSVNRKLIPADAVPVVAISNMISNTLPPGIEKSSSGRSKVLPPPSVTGLANVNTVGAEAYAEGPIS
jgi:hypothetical protein